MLNCFSWLYPWAIFMALLFLWMTPNFPFLQAHRSAFLVTWSNVHVFSCPSSLKCLKLNSSFPKWVNNISSLHPISLHDTLPLFGVQMLYLRVTHHTPPTLSQPIVLYQKSSFHIVFHSSSFLLAFPGSFLQLPCFLMAISSCLASSQLPVLTSSLFLPGIELIFFLK